MMRGEERMGYVAVYLVQDVKDGHGKEDGQGAGNLHSDHWVVGFVIISLFSGR